MNKKHYTQKSALILFLVLFAKLSFAQKTGSFNETITFNNEQRTLSFFVPANYDSTKPYRLFVGLHGAGDNSNNYRNAITNLFINNMTNTILVCPDGGNDQARSFNLPAGDEEIIQEAINMASTKYNIDATNIILQGFSLGGRSALQYGLVHPEKFKGLLLNTPAIQGVKDALGQTFFGPFKYENASKVPIYITHGDADLNYTAPIDTAYEKLILNDGVVRLFRFAGMGHTIPAFNQIQNFISFFDQPAFDDYDVEVVKAFMLGTRCTQAVPAFAFIRNIGKNTINSVWIRYELNGKKDSTEWKGTLLPYQHTYALLNDQLAATALKDTLNVISSIINGNSSNKEINTTNNNKSIIFEHASEGIKLPLTEGFEGADFPPAGWLLNRSGDYLLPWTRDTDTKKDGAASIVTFNSIFVFDNSGRKEEILSPVLDLSSVSNPVASFDIAYNYIRYTPPYFTDTTNFADTLEVLISTDCGNTFTSLFKKGGKDLATFDEPILNPLNLNEIDFTPTASNWRREQIDLSNYKSNTEAVIKFSYISALGGLISIDNVSFSNTTGINENKSVANNFKLFPNPATDKVNIVIGDESVLKVKVIDLAGRTVMTVTNENRNNTEMSVNTSSLDNGFYIFEVVTAKGLSTSKVLIKR